MRTTPVPTTPISCHNGFMCDFFFNIVYHFTSIKLVEPVVSMGWTGLNWAGRLKAGRPMLNNPANMVPRVLSVAPDAVVPTHSYVPTPVRSEYCTSIV